MNKVEIMCSNSNYDLEKEIEYFAKDHNIINVIFYRVEYMHFQKRAMVIYN